MHRMESEEEFADKSMDERDTYVFIKIDEKTILDWHERLLDKFTVRSNILVITLLSFYRAALLYSLLNYVS